MSWAFPAFVGISGVIIGALLAWVLSLLRAVLEAQSAARLVKWEFACNAAVVEQAFERASHGGRNHIELSDELFKRYALKLVPFLDDDDIGTIVATTMFTAQARAHFDLYKTDPELPVPRKTLERWANDQIEAGSRLVEKLLMRAKWRLLFSMFSYSRVDALSEQRRHPEPDHEEVTP